MCSFLRISTCAAFLAVTLAIAPNSVNINLETSIRIGSRENIHTVLGNLTRFLDKVKHALLPTHKVYIKRRAQETKSKKYFTNFLNDVVETILNFKYDETFWFFSCLYKEIKYYFKYKGSAFADIVKNPVLKKYLENTLKKWSETDADKIKRNIRNYVAIARNKNNTLNRIGDFINKFYDEKDEKKMQEIVNKLKNCSNEKDFANAVRYALHNLVIKHYDKLNYTIRTKISHEINRLSEYAIKRRSKGDADDLKSILKNIDRFGNNTQTTKEVTSAVNRISKDIDDNIIAIPDKGYVSDDIEIIKNKYHFTPKGNYNNSENKIVFRQDTENKIITTTS
ncbi:uncharacterized protein LOC134677648, partial [Cydia fagiglandana]|uniref:uncharacterized protein LOC134677648 n=1 Tax=Cydia fagiglandana TaxID=1458189 RepID=UPI002FEE481B